MSKEKLPRGIRRRKNNLFICFAANGKLVRQSVGDVDVELAKEELYKAKRAVREGTYIPKVKQAKPGAAPVVYTVKDLWDGYLLEYKNGGGRDAGRLEIAWNHLEDSFATVRVVDVTTHRINTYIDAWRAKGLSNGTINREVSTLKSMFKYGTRVTPRMVELLPAFPKKLAEAEPRDEFVKDPAYAVLAKNAKELWLRAMIAVAYTYGFRKGELLNLRVGQVDTDEGKIALRREDTKNKTARKVKMTTEVYELMNACCDGKKEDDFVFTREDGSHVVDPRQEWYDLCVASKLGRYVPAKRKNGSEFKSYVGLNLHDFRRSAIRNMIRRGVSQTVAMKISGHKTASVFRRYDITTDDDKPPI